jgi:tetratricopeptide (TPR) repeat protein
VSAIFGLIGFLSRLRAWATGHWLRSVIVAGTILTLIGATIGGWAYLASVALRAGELKIDAALEAYDKGNYEAARSLVTHMLTGGRLPRSEYGGPLFVLGAIKTNDAQQQAVPERRRIEFLISSRYLTEARAYGYPPGREAYGDFLLGQSLVESGQFDEGTQILKDLAAQTTTSDALRFQSQQVLAETCLRMPHPRLEEALRYTDLIIATPKITSDELASALFKRAECQSRLERFDEARLSVQRVPAGDSSTAAIALNLGRISLDQVEAALQKVAMSDRPQAAAEKGGEIDDALANLKRANSLDDQKSRIAPLATYEIGRGLAIKGDYEGALKQFGRVRQLFGESYEGLAASLGEANVLRQKGDFESALLAYRRVLDEFTSIPVYRSQVLPVEKIREQLIAAQADLLDREHYSDALALIEHFTPLFNHTEQLELRGDTLEKWGNQLLIQANDEATGSARTRSEGLEHLRAAGVAFEKLAESRFSTRFYTSDLWRSAGDFFQGQNFSHTVQILRKYLEYEPELRNAQTLLRLGQAQLALGQIPQSIAALEECIEFHPLDTSTFQARIDCAKAYWYQGNIDRAEELLRENIAGSSLKPTSPEWKDSLFELGMLLHERAKFEEAIGVLEEAVERYPQDSHCRSAQYVIGECYRRWAEEPLAEARRTHATSEHDKSLQLGTQRLNAALRQFESVQRSITLKTHDIHSDPLAGTMLRNCYMFEGAVLFDLGRYKEAIEAYSNVSSLYPDEPFVLETFVQISNCWRRLNRRDNAHGAVHQAQIALERLPAEAKFDNTTALNREEWRMLLANMSKW